jgi:hypothetical protein
MKFEIWYDNQCWYTFPTMEEAERQLKKIQRLFEGRFEIKRMWI